IYQKQEPVNIPRTETRTLQDILELPWGFEIYSLLTRWNPLNLVRWLPQAESGYKVLVVGLGPAGFNLSHHLLNDGHIVVAVDGLKIEPMPEQVSGRNVLGQRVPFEPVHRIEDIFDDLATRVNGGFGGVAEYGITVRWNKNYLKVIRLLLERRAQFGMVGGVRFGGTLTYDKAFELGFDHVALCLGAGRPTVINMPNGMARGVRTASDFLMALQLTGAAKEDSIANLQLRLPVAVIGGGLTAIDTATESLAYYPLQVEKFLKRYETLVQELGEATVRARWSTEETEIAEEFIAHAKSIRLEREKALKESRKPKIVKLLHQWGGVHVVYRKTLQDSPSYRLNHEEIELAMQEGIGFIENASPAGVEINECGYAQALRVDYAFQNEAGEQVTEERLIPAKTIFMAAGTNPNTVLHREDATHFALDGKYFSAVDSAGNLVKPEPNISKPAEAQVLMSKSEGGKFVSFFGDLHPSYVGNVVKAMGSAKQGYPVVSRVLMQQTPLNSQLSGEFITGIQEQLVARVHDVVRLTPTIVEVIIKAPLAARQFLPGQFYRLQNYETLAMKSAGTTLTMEGLALTGAWVDREKGLLSTIVLEMGGSSDLCAYLKKDEPVILMGPTGTPTETPGGETVMLVGGGLGNAVLFSIGKAFKDAGSRVLYFAGYKQAVDRYKVDEIQAAADEIIWCCDEKLITDKRPEDKSFHGNIVQAMVAYAKGELGTPGMSLDEVDRIIAIGSDRMMAAVQQARHNVLKPYLKTDHKAIGSINSPMQCMMKEICGQCLQKHVDPDTGKETYVYSCFNQDQELDYVSFPHLNERLQQNGVQEKLTALWIDRCLKGLGLREEAA
ncbi:MAG: FAD-dependent oxidoreductase, partial [Rickettsiales bacterium]|nr:FAD-dependent oxidoreductase [Rickettsiales bacterium]